MAKSAHVPSQYLGYSIQETRMVYLLLAAPAESSVSIEVLDDVAISFENGDKLAQQIKSTTSSHNPISDFSIELWKTFYNWLSSIESGELDVDKTKFEIYISKPQKSVFAKKMSSASTTKEVNEILSDLNKTYLQKKDSLSSELKKYIEKVLGFDSKTLLLMFKNFTVEEGSGDTTSEVVQALHKNKAIPSDIVDSVGVYLLGWVKKTTDKLLQDKKPAVIKEEDFRGELQAIIRKLDRANTLQSFAPSPDPKDIEGEKIKTYVLQLGIIDQDDGTILHAINDYLKASIDRVEWARKGLVSSSSFEEYENHLKNVWKNSKTKISITNKGLSETEVGKLIFIECSECKTELQGLLPPSSFTAGSFHELADVLEIGWHPSYKTIIEEEKTKELLG